MRVSDTSVCLFVLLVALFYCGSSLTVAYASLGGTAVATSFEVVGGAMHGDIVSYNPSNETFAKSAKVGDEQLFGVVVSDPILFVGSNTATSQVPIVRDGEAEVAVSTLGGPIEVGDYITTSRIEGVGQRVNANRRIYVLGVALEHFGADAPGASFALVGTEQVAVGQILVALRMGFYVPEFEDSALKGSTGDAADAGQSNTVLGALNEENRSFMVVRYILAALVTFSAIVIALRSFGGSLSDSIVSVGRNPMARSYILSMMLWNSMLILVVSGVGLALGAAIIIYP